MQLLFRSYATTAVAVIGASLIYVTPPATPDTDQVAVALVAAWNVTDIGGPIDSAVSSSSPGGGIGLVPSPAEADLPQYLDPAFWDYWWGSLGTADPIDLWFGLINALASIPLIGPVFSVVGIVSFALLFLSGGPQSAAADGWDSGPVPLAEAAMTVGAGPVADDIVALSSDAPGLRESAAALEDPGTMLDLGAVMSLLELSGIGVLDAGLGMVDVADAFASPGIIDIPELDDFATSLVS